MARTRLPIEVVQARGRKHLGKAEIEERHRTEIKPIFDNIVAPDYLTKKQKDSFYEISEQLKKLKIMGETDVDALARYIKARDLYVKLTKKLESRDILNDIEEFETYSRAQDRYFKQCVKTAADLGLTISSRCKLIVPGANKEEERPVNKFKKFEKSG